MRLNELRPSHGATKKRKRVGRGPGSGHGKTATKGHKGHQARSGGGKNKSFEGGQMPLTRRIPKFGFKNPFRVEYQVVNLDKLAVLYPSGGEVTIDDLVAKGAVRRDRPVKVLGTGEIAVAVQVSVNAFSESAKNKIAAAGGSTTQL